MTISFRNRLQKGDVVIGSLLQMPLPEIAESFVQAGYDWLFIDLEHSPMDARNALDILTAVDVKIPCVVRVPWNDGVFVGPFDMSGSMDLPGQINHPQLQEAIRKVVKACEKRDIARCIYAHWPQHARTYMEKGYRVIGLCTDYIMLARTAAEYLKAVR